jgi:hypothetical protein
MKKKWMIPLMAIALVACGAEEEKEEENEKEETTEEAVVKETAEATPDQEDGHYGAKITEDGALTPEAFMAAIADKDSMETKVVAQINQVCQKKGCWMTLNMGDGPEMRVKFKDYDFFVPKDADGKTAVIEGWAKMEVVSVEFQKHLLDDAKEAGEEVSQEEYDAITAPKTELTFMANGVIIKDSE